MANFCLNSQIYRIINNHILDVHPCSNSTEFRGIGRRSSDWLQKCSCCHVDVKVLCLFLAVSWAGLRYVIVAIPCHTHFPFGTVFWDLPHGIVGCSVVCEFCISWSYYLALSYSGLHYVNRPLLAQWHKMSQLALLKSQLVYSFSSVQKTNKNGADETAHIHNLICM